MFSNHLTFRSPSIWNSAAFFGPLVPALNETQWRLNEEQLQNLINLINQTDYRVYKSSEQTSTAKILTQGFKHNNTPVKKVQASQNKFHTIFGNKICVTKHWHQHLCLHKVLRRINRPFNLSVRVWVIAHYVERSTWIQIGR